MNVSPGPLGAPLPTGTVTFLFSDIEGSTQRWGAHPDAMPDALRRHDALMQASIVGHQGHVFKTVGDAFCAAFARPQQAVGAALAAQRALASEDFSAVDGVRVRMAIHTGTADERDNDYFGPAVNRVARLLAVGHGGQVLMSRVTSDLVQGALPPHASLRDLGEHRLRDLAHPEHISQLLAPGLAAEFPALRSLDVLPNNLPLQVTSFVGRDTEIAEITALLDAHRLVTLVGSGGIGKTRTSLQVAASLLDGSGDGVWFVELAPLTSGDYIPSTVAQAMEFTLPSEGDPVENLARALNLKRALLVFDNCEHLVEPAARVISAVLRGCRHVKMLASSRQALGIAGEQMYRLPTLDVPLADDVHRLSARDGAHCTAIALFVERARAVDARFALNDENAPIVAEICRRLDGIPMAIELAASRVKILSPEQLRERLDQRFRVLAGGSRDVLPRQQTLRAMIDWSHDLLDERERTLFRRLGIFVNGFTLEGATGIGGGAELDELEVLDVLASLVDKSLVLAEQAGASLRYRLLESTRVYALEKLDGAGEREVLARRHLRYLRNTFAELGAHVERTGQKTKLTEGLQIELEDVRSALDGALARSDVVEGGEFLATIGDAWGPFGLDPEGIARCETYLAALPAGEPQLRARLSTALSDLLGQSGQKVRALEVAIEAVEHARASGDPSTLARALNVHAHRATFFDDTLDAAQTSLAEAEAIPGASPSLRLDLISASANLHAFRGDYAASARIYEQLRKESRSLGSARGEQLAAQNLAEIEHVRGQTKSAIAITQEIEASTRSGTDLGMLANLLQNRAGYLAALDDLPGAVAAAREAIGIRATREPAHVHVAIGIEHLALVFALRGDLARAATLEGYADATLQRHGFEREFTERTSHDRLATLLREKLASNHVDRLLVGGSALSPQAAVALALEDP